MNDEEKIVPTEQDIEGETEFYIEAAPGLMNEEKAQAFKDNLKNDFIWFTPGINKMSIIQCTCGQFLEADTSNDAGFGRLAKKGLRHHQRTGHTINPRGN